MECRRAMQDSGWPGRRAVGCTGAKHSLPSRHLHRRHAAASSALRGRRSPARAHTAAVDAARRLHCAARPAVASRNSLRSLRSLRSNSRDESDHEARAAHAPTPSLRCSSPQRSPRPKTACREAEPPSAPDRCVNPFREPTPFRQRRVRARPGVRERRREAQGMWPRAQRASSSDLPRLFERSERSERSEFCGRPRDRASQGSRRACADRRSRTPGRARTRLCRAPTSTREPYENDSSLHLIPASAAAGTSATRSPA